MSIDRQTLEGWLLPLPGVSSDLKWGGDLVFSVAAKMFAVYCDIPGPDFGKLSYKVPPERFLEYTEQPGILPAPYMARAHWIQLQPQLALSDEAIHADLLRARSLVIARLPKWQQRELV